MQGCAGTGNAVAEAGLRLYLAVSSNAGIVRQRLASRAVGTRPVPKIKSKRSAMKRFRLTGTGKVRRNFAGKRHGMIKRTNKFIRNARGDHYRVGARCPLHQAPPASEFLSWNCPHDTRNQRRHDPPTSPQGHQGRQRHPRPPEEHLFAQRFNASRRISSTPTVTDAHGNAISADSGSSASMRPPAATGYVTAS